jgi:hypothetical protein
VENSAAHLSLNNVDGATAFFALICSSCPTHPTRPASPDSLTS